MTGPPPRARAAAVWRGLFTRALTAALLALWRVAAPAADALKLAATGGCAASLSSQPRLAPIDPARVPGRQPGAPGPAAWLAPWEGKPRAPPRPSRGGRGPRPQPAVAARA